MFNFLAATFGRLQGRPPGAAEADDGHADAFDGSVRFRPRLTVQILRDHEASRQQMRALLDACRARDEDAEVVCLRRFADGFRKTGLIKSAQFYPYLRWALEKDRVATMQLESTRRDLARASLLIEATLCDYLEAPWDSRHRRRFVDDVARMAGVFSRALRQEESTLLPLYMPPGQYRYVHNAPGD